MRVFKIVSRSDIISKCMEIYIHCKNEEDAIRWYRENHPEGSINSIENLISAELVILKY
jgi:hypothetical protein